jgi:hypothetical protein
VSSAIRKEDVLMHRTRLAALVFALATGCGGGGGGRGGDPDPFALCSDPDDGTGCKVTFSGAISGKAECSEWDDAAGGAWFFSLSPGVSYPSANVAITVANVPAAPVIYAMEELAYVSADATSDGSTYWYAGSTASGSTLGDLTLTLTQVSGGYHGAVAATLAPGPQGGGNVTMCATF